MPVDELQRSSAAHVALANEDGHVGLEPFTAVKQTERSSHVHGAAKVVDSSSLGIDSPDEHRSLQRRTSVKVNALKEVDGLHVETPVAVSTVKDHGNLGGSLFTNHRFHRNVFARNAVIIDACNHEVNITVGGQGW